MASDDATKGDKGAKGKMEEHGGGAGADEPEEPKVKREEEVMDMDVLPLSLEDPMKGPSEREQPGRYIHHAFIDLEMEATESSSDVRARVFEQDLARNVVRIKDRDLDYKNAIYDANQREEGSAGEAVPGPGETREAERDVSMSEGEVLGIGRSEGF